MRNDVLTALPAGFASLSRFGDWVLPTEKLRIEARLETPYAISLEFYEVMLAEMPRVMEHLLTCDTDSVSHEDENLMYLAFSLVEIANAVEIYGESEIPDGAQLRNFISVLEEGTNGAG
jgi:hypothetical protein